MKKHALWMLAAGLLLAADAPKDDAVKKELTKADGLWQVVSFEIDGNKLGDDEAKAIKMTIKEGKYHAKSMDNTVSRGLLVLNPSKKPTEVDIKPEEGDNQGQTMPGIYELKDDDLKICFAPPDKTRPTKFQSEAGSGHNLIVFKRVKS